MDQQKRELLEEPPIFSTRGTLSTIDMLFYLLNSGIGSGTLHMGEIFHSGLLFSYILLLIFGFVTFLSTRLFVLAAAKYHQSTFEEIWIASFGKITVFIPAAFSLVSSICNIISYTQFAQTALIKIISMIIVLINEESVDTVAEIESHKFLVGLIVCVIYYIPFSFSRQVNFLSVASYINVFTFILFIIYVIVRSALRLVDDGFDPYKKFQLFNVSKDVYSSLSSTIFSFLIFPIAFPGLRHVKNSSPTNLKKIFGFTILIIFFFYLIMGTFDYFTFYGWDRSGTILEYYLSKTETDKILLIVGYFLALIYVSCTTPICINVCRYVTMNLIQSFNFFTMDIWILLGITFSFVSVALSGLDDEYLDIVFLIGHIMAACVQYIFPAILYIRAYKVTQKLNFATSIFVMIIGIGCVAFMIYYDIFE